MTRLELEIRTRDAAWKAPPPGSARANASIAARDRRILLRALDALRAVQARVSDDADPFTFGREDGAA